MGVKDVKIGDKLRYLGGDPANTGELARGFVYDVVDIDGDVIVIDTVDNGSWAIGEYYKNVDCFGKVEEGEKSTLDLIANLAQEVAQLKREVNELKASKANREDIEKFAETASNAELLAKKATEKDDDIAELGRIFLRILKREADE